MIKLMGWRKLLTCATIDAILVVAAGSAWAAPAGHAAAPGSALPVLLLVGVAMMCANWRRDAIG